MKIKRASLWAIIALLVVLLPVSAKSNSFPDLIQLPTGFRPEGIAVGKGTTFYTGSLANGAIYRGDLRTGQGSIFIPGQTGMVTVGLGFDKRGNRLFAAGGGTGLGRVFDARTGALLKSYQLASAGNFINDVVITREAAFFTNSSQALLYRVPFGKNGSLPDDSAVQALPLSGGWEQVAGFNANGIEATPNGKHLVVVNSTAGKLYKVDPRSGAASEIDLGGESVSAGDGLRFRDELLYVVRNRLNEIVVIDLNKDLTKGKVEDRLTNPNFNVPTTLAAFGDNLYAVNAKFGAATPDAIPYEVVKVQLDD